MAAPRLVMKFGGSSLADHAKLRAAARKVAQRHADGTQVVVVVSAMGSTTDALVSEAHEIHPTPSRRELDMLMTTGERHSMVLLALALEAEGIAATSLTGSQCGILTDHQHGRARVMEVRPFRILDELAAGRAVVVGGFQGVSYRREITTLGRGGSDTSAVAIAAALDADCEIYSDVAGVYSADPRLVPTARRVESLDYDEAIALASGGAKILHEGCLRLAKEQGVAIYARSSTEPGQSVVRRDPPRSAGIRAVAGAPARVLLKLKAELEDPQLRARVVVGMTELGLDQLRVDQRGARAIYRPELRDDLSVVQSDLAQLGQSLGGALREIVAQEELAELCGVGQSLQRHPELLDAACEVLAPFAWSELELEADALRVRLPAAHYEVALRAMHDRLVLGGAG